jgi:hypothetical protein
MLNGNCKWPATNRKKAKRVGSYINNDGLDELGSSVEKGETVYLASIFGGTSTD